MYQHGCLVRSVELSSEVHEPHVCYFRKTRLIASLAIEGEVIMAKEMIVVEGGTPLIGEVKVSGAKNSALKLIAASILGGGESVIHNVPLISDITIMSKVLEIG